MSIRHLRPTEGPGWGASEGGGKGGVPRMASLINNYNKQINRKSEKTQKTKIRLVVYNVFFTFSHEGENEHMVDTHIRSGV